MCVSVCLCLFVHACVGVCVYVCACVCESVSMCMNACVCLCVCVLQRRGLMSLCLFSFATFLDLHALRRGHLVLMMKLHERKEKGTS